MRVLRQPTSTTNTVVPSSTGAVLVFMLLVAPGLLFDLLSARRHAGVPESGFREASRVVLASTGFTVAAVALAWGISWVCRVRLPDFARMLADSAYRADHIHASVLAPVATSAVACALAYGTHLWLARGTPGRLQPQSAWFRAFRHDVPPGSAPYVRIRTVNGSTYCGFVGYFTPSLETEGRELALVPPLWSAAPGRPLTPLPREWQRVVVPGQDIVSVLVSFRPDPSPTVVRRSLRERLRQGH